MEYWESNTDESLIFNSGPCHSNKIRSHSAKPNIPTIQYSIIPGSVFTVRLRIISDLAQRTRFFIIDYRLERCLDT